MHSPITQVTQFIALMEKLKNELRHSWTSTGRQESVAEHSWRLALLVMTIHPHLEHPVDLNRCLKMAIIHDCVEALAGDIPVFDLVSQSDHASKQAREEAAIAEIATLLGPDTGSEISALWYEFEHRQTGEAKLVYALDKLECKIQHNEANLSTWNEHERNFSIDWQDELYDFDVTVMALKNQIMADTKQKLQAEMANETEA